MWNCTVCGIELTRKDYSTSCNNWLHLRCSGFYQDQRIFLTIYCSVLSIAAQSTLQNIPNYAPVPPAIPPPNNTTISNSSFKILQWNCNGLRGCIQELLNFMNIHEIKVAALQETKMTSTANISTPNHSLIRLDRERGGTGGRIAFLIHNSFQYSIKQLINPAELPPIEQHAITIKSENTSITIANVYIPPATPNTRGIATNIEHLLNQNIELIAGAFNGHNTMWYTNHPSDTREN